MSDDVRRLATAMRRLIEVITGSADPDDFDDREWDKLTSALGIVSEIEEQHNSTPKPDVVA